MSRATQTIGAGFRALGGANMASYSLEFLTQSGSRRPGTTETIVVPYAEMGRDRSCAIRFDSTEKTVSRKHAAISNENGQYFITPLSQTNQTFVNGAPIQTKAPLNNGSEIQLSSNGPRMRFLASQTKTSTLRLTQRMQMFASQSLRPYRRAVIMLTIVLLTSVGGLGYYSWDQSEQAKKQINEQGEKLSDLEEINTKLISDLTKVSKNQATLKRDLRNQRKINDSIRKSGFSETNISSALADWEVDVYGIEITFLSFAIDGEITKTSLNTGLIGTGFLLEDGTFVTALHVIMPWFFDNDPSWRRLNMLHTAGDYVNIEIVATSPEGKKIRLSSEDFNYNISHFDTKKDLYGNTYKVSNLKSLQDDWAWIQTNRRGKMIADNNLSKNLNAGTSIYTLGYMYGMDEQSGTNFNPLLSKMNVAQKGLDNGIIKISGRSFDSGNSGGPAFVTNNKGELKVVGIVSYKSIDPEDNKDRVLGGIVPFSSLNK